MGRASIIFIFFRVEILNNLAFTKVRLSRLSSFATKSKIFLIVCSISSVLPVLSEVRVFISRNLNRRGSAPLERSIYESVVLLNFLRAKISSTLLIFEKSHHLFALLRRNLLDLAVHQAQILLSTDVQIDASSVL